jgi:hypothetical protein
MVSRDARRKTSRGRGIIERLILAGNAIFA